MLDRAQGVDSEMPSLHAYKREPLGDPIAPRFGQVWAHLELRLYADLQDMIHPAVSSSSAEGFRYR